MHWTVFRPLCLVTRKLCFPKSHLIFCDRDWTLETWHHIASSILQTQPLVSTPCTFQTSECCCVLKLSRTSMLFVAVAPQNVFEVKSILIERLLSRFFLFYPRSRSKYKIMSKTRRLINHQNFIARSKAVRHELNPRLQSDITVVRHRFVHIATFSSTLTASKAASLMDRRLIWDQSQ